jgi:hypothetical protein
MNFFRRSEGNRVGPTMSPDDLQSLNRPPPRISDADELTRLLERISGSGGDFQIIDPMVTRLRELSGRGGIVGSPGHLRQPTESETIWQWFVSWTELCQSQGRNELTLKIFWFAMFWGDNIRDEAYAYGLSLGYPTKNQLIEIGVAAQLACAELPAGQEVVRGVTVHDIESSLTM